MRLLMIMVMGLSLTATMACSGKKKKRAKATVRMSKAAQAAKMKWDTLCVTRHGKTVSVIGPE